MSLKASEVKMAIEFARDWNNGVSVADMASKYSIKPATVRNRVASFRKKGVNLVPRSRGFSLGEDDVKKINAAIAK